MHFGGGPKKTQKSLAKNQAGAIAVVNETSTTITRAHITLSRVVHPNIFAMGGLGMLELRLKLLYEHCPESQTQAANAP